jgi:hypothetical protein
MGDIIVIIINIIIMILPEGKGRTAIKTDNLIAICEPVVSKMWEPRRLTTLWTSMFRYRDSSTFISFFEKYEIASA